MDWWDCTLGEVSPTRVGLLPPLHDIAKKLCALDVDDVSTGGEHDEHVNCYLQGRRNRQNTAVAPAARVLQQAGIPVFASLSFRINTSSSKSTGIVTVLVGHKLGPVGNVHLC